MQETGNWVKCYRCNHKLYRLYKGVDASNSHSKSKEDKYIIEIKCHSCKAINNIKVI